MTLAIDIEYNNRYNFYITSLKGYEMDRAHEDYRLLLFAMGMSLTTFTYLGVEHTYIKLSDALTFIGASDER